MQPAIAQCPGRLFGLVPVSLHDAWSTTGPQTSILASRNGKTSLWKPFWPLADVYGVERNLYKNLVGNQLVFATKPDVLRQVIDSSGT